MFCDLNIKRPTHSSQSNFLEEALLQLLDYGYKVIAVSTDVDESVFQKKVKEKKIKTKDSPVEAKDCIPLPFDLSSIRKKFGKKLKIYSRLNVTVSDNLQLQKLYQSKNFKKYDLLAVQPLNQNVLRSLISSPNVNIISFDPEAKNTLFFNRKLYNQLVSQNIYFEIIYSPALVDASARKHLIALSHLFHAVGKSKNVIVSSGAQLALQIRGPHDIMNLNLLFGLSEEQARSAISHNCHKVLQEARKIQRGKSTVHMISLNSKSGDNIPTLELSAI